MLKSLIKRLKGNFTQQIPFENTLRKLALSKILHQENFIEENVHPNTNHFPEKLSPNKKLPWRLLLSGSLYI